MWLAKLLKLRERGQEDQFKPFLDHLEDLRWTIVKMAITLVSSMIFAFAFRVQLVEVLQQPLRAVDASLVNNLQALSPVDSVTLSFKLAFYAGLVLSFPLQLYLLAEFVLPGLSAKEKRYLLPAVGAGCFLFISGVLFSHCIVIPSTLAFFYKDQATFGWSPQWGVHQYFSFVTQFTLGFGLSFELPVVVLLLVKLGVVNFQIMSATRPYAIVILTILSAIITPTTDILTLICMSMPMLVLYEICIWISRFMQAKEDAPPEHPDLKA